MRAEEGDPKIGEKYDVRQGWEVSDLYLLARSRH